MGIFEYYMMISIFIFSKKLPLLVDDTVEEKYNYLLSKKSFDSFDRS